MKKWLDDLYAIILKRGFKTLDNSLKNYDKLKKQIPKIMISGTVNAGQSFTFDLNNCEIETNGVILVKCVFSDTRIAILSLIKLTPSYYSRLINYGISSGISVSLSENILTITNNVDHYLHYSLSVNDI